MSYRIEDEPRPGGLAHLAVHPMWPLFAVMFGGAGLSWSWFVVNAFAVGSPTRRRELLWAIGGLAGSFVLIILVGLLQSAGALPEGANPFIPLAFTVWKLFVSYTLFMLQSRSFHLYEYFGGTTRNGMLVVVAGFFILRRVYGTLPGLWQILLM